MNIQIGSFEYSNDLIWIFKSRSWIFKWPNLNIQIKVMNIQMTSFEYSNKGHKYSNDLIWIFKLRSWIFKWHNLNVQIKLWLFKWPNLNIQMINLNIQFIDLIEYSYNLIEYLWVQIQSVTSIFVVLIFVRLTLNLSTLWLAPSCSPKKIPGATPDGEKAP